ncbi:MAG: hypothetical protein WC822_06465, partial [Candidatus Paceibacterota bacterium]
YPSRELLASRLGFASSSVKSIDRFIAELVSAGFITKTARVTPAGDHTSNLYQIMLLSLPRGVAVTQHPPSGQLTPTPSGWMTTGTVSISNSNHRTGADEPRGAIEIVQDSPKPDKGYKEVFRLFSKVPQGWMHHRAQIDAAKRLAAAPGGVEGLKRALDWYKENKDLDYMVKIYTPHDFEAKLPKLHAKKVEQES